MELTRKEYDKIFKRMCNGLRARYHRVYEDMLVSAITDSYDAVIESAKSYEDIEAYWVTCTWRKYLDYIRSYLRKMDKTIPPEEQHIFGGVQASMPPVYSHLQLLDDILNLPTIERSLVMAILNNDIGIQVPYKDVNSIRGKMKEWYYTNVSNSLRNYRRSCNICREWIRSMA